MIIGMCLKEIFKEQTILVDGFDVALQFHFGDQKELNRWIASKDLYGKAKYPLVWYVTNTVETEPQNLLKSNSQLIIMYLTKSEYMNDTRFEVSYLKYIEPTYEKICKLLNENTNVLNNSSKNGFLPYKDEPNFGVETNEPNSANSDFKKTTSKGTKSITLDIVDARVMSLNIGGYAKCIINK